MPDIQIDMFEVQLGAALLLQFAVDGDTVRVLADAGVKASGYKPWRVRDKLKDMLGSDLRIDLVIGTHYDEDHLTGLVPIIEDAAFTIGEAWMPPVVNDVLAYAADQPLQKSHLLVHQFAGEDGREVLASYLAAKRSDIEALGSVGFDLFPEGESPFKSINADSDEYRSDEKFDDLDYFRRVRDDDPDDVDHCAELEIDDEPTVLQMIENVRRSFWPRWYDGDASSLKGLKSIASDRGHYEAEYSAARGQSLVHMQKSAAKDAINAAALHEVVQALAKRGIPIRSEIIEDGTPRRYRWNSATRRFVAAKANAAGLSFDLLGPSRSLVKKHRHRLPVFEASKVALAYRGEIRSITPSNQLSYVGCFRHADQSILVSGDAGCVDFKSGHKTYHPELLAAMNPLHVVQVAHHGGNNAHFYRVLAAAGYPEQADPSFLLLSHATHDKTRPSDVFREFLLTSLGEGDDIRLLFTSEPTLDKVEDFLAAIHPVVGAAGEVGDIRLVHDAGAWRVDAHAISAGKPSTKRVSASVPTDRIIRAPKLKLPAKREGE